MSFVYQFVFVDFEDEILALVNYPDHFPLYLLFSTA